MHEVIENFRKKIVRKAIVFDIGGFRPPENNITSWFGSVYYGKKGEIWPFEEGEPMLGLAQINLTELPFKPDGLEDLDYICVFVSKKKLPVDSPNGENWIIRTYKDISELVPLEQADTGSWLKSFPMKPRIVENDYPCWEDLPVKCPEEIDDDYYKLFKNVDGFKLGGWPSLIQSEIFWAPFNQHEAEPEYVFQIDTTTKGNWTWGDNGVGYFGRGTVKGKAQAWALSWQCY